MTVYPFIDTAEGVEITESEHYQTLTQQTQGLLDGLNLRPAKRAELQHLLTGKEQEAARLAFICGVRAGDLHAHLVGRLQRRD